MKKSKGKKLPVGDALPMITKLEFWPIEKLKPYLNNSRTHSQEQVAELAASFTEFGVCQPVAVHPQLGIVTGEGRYLAATMLKLKKMPVINLFHLSVEQARAYVIADNRLAENAGWNQKKLTEELRQIMKAGEVELQVIGWSDDELKAMLPELTKEEDEDQGNGGTGSGSTEPPKHPFTRLGDLFSLGESRLLCGDSTQKSDVIRLMEGAKADMVFTDPPYNIASDSANVANSKGSTSNAHRELGKAEWDKNFSFDRTFPILDMILSENCSVYICTSHYLFGSIQEWVKGWANCTNYIVWCKQNPMPSLMKRHWTWGTELICYGTRGKHAFNFPKEGHALNWWSVNKSSVNEFHPTQKPIELPERAITHSSNRGQIVVDLFGGGGSTMLAAERTERLCYSMEINPAYCDVILDRWSELSGKDPIRSDGVPWSRIKTKKRK